MSHYMNKNEVFSDRTNNDNLSSYNNVNSQREPKKDRRALLAEWRSKSKARAAASSVGGSAAAAAGASPAPAASSLFSACDNSSLSAVKRPRSHSNSSRRMTIGPSSAMSGHTGGSQQQQQYVNEPPPKQHRTLSSLSPGGFAALPPQDSNNMGREMSATERFRLAMEQRRQQEAATIVRLPSYNDSENINPEHSASVNDVSYSANSSFNYGSDSDLSNKATKYAQPKRSSTRRKSFMPSSSTRPSLPPQPLAPSTNFTQHAAISEHCEGSIESNEGIGSGTLGHRSRIAEMQQRITQLEQEKMQLSLAKAPLETRMKQKEDAWMKDQMRFMEEIDALKKSKKESEEKVLSLKMERDNLKDENSRLQFENRKASSKLNQQGSVMNDQQVAELQEMLRHTEKEVNYLKLDKVSLEGELQATNMELDSLFRTHEELQKEFEELSEEKTESKDAVAQLEALTREHIATAAQLNAVNADLAETKSNHEEAMKYAEEQWKKEAAELKFQISVLKARGGELLDNEEEAGSQGEVEDEAVLRARIEERDNRIKELEEQLLKADQTRRVMHNRIQELRGNIRVFVRTRPFLPADGQSKDTPIEVAPDGENLGITGRGGDMQRFKFDKVFAQSAGQDCVFTEVSDFIQSALDGYNVCLFSYGQTGSGKTHTMQGSGNSTMRGIIPRAVELILSQTKFLQSQKWQFNLSASFLEIYNEDLRDLLVAHDSGTKRNKGHKLAIKRDIKGKSYVDGLNSVKIDTEDSGLGMDQLESVMKTAAKSRSVASTKMNDVSSRSHSVFMLHVHGVNEGNGTVIQGSLNLCDLAGSERLDRSGAGSDAKRLKETQAINKSLSCLGDVFSALASGSKHVPFRNSKLTYLLQDCLSGDGKALMFVNLSPTLASSHESLCSLRFAQRVNQVELGKATKHVQYLNN